MKANQPDCVFPQQTETVASNIKSLQAYSAIIVTLDAEKYSGGDNFNDCTSLVHGATFIAKQVVEVRPVRFIY